MPLTSQQLTALKADIAANTNTIPAGRPFAGTQIKDLPNSADANEEISRWYNLTASGNYKVYKPSVTEGEIFQNGMDWARVDNLSVGKSRIWEWMFKFGSANPSKANVRTGINSVWVGTQADLNVRAAVYLHCQRDASNAEKLLKSAGAGTAADASGDGPATLGYESPLTRDDIENARNSP